MSHLSLENLEIQLGDALHHLKLLVLYRLYRLSWIGFFKTEITTLFCSFYMIISESDIKFYL